MEEEDLEETYGTPVGTFTVFGNAQPKGMTWDDWEEFQETMEALGFSRETEEERTTLNLFSLVALFDRELNILFASGKLIAVYALAFIAIAILTYAAFNSPDGIAQSYSIEVASGIALFFAVPAALVGLNGRYKHIFWLLCIVIAAGSGATSLFTQGPAQSFCVEACVGTALLMALDLAWANVIKRSHRALEEARSSA